MGVACVGHGIYEKHKVSLTSLRASHQGGDRMFGPDRDPKDFDGVRAVGGKGFGRGGGLGGGRGGQRWGVELIPYWYVYESNANLYEYVY